MYSTQVIQEAIDKIFASAPPRKELTLDKIRSTVATYFYVDEKEIGEAELTAALRNTDFAIPRPRTRGSAHIAWFFVKKQSVQQVKAIKKPKYKNKPLADSLKMKSA